MPKRISKDTPLNEITLRRYERPYKMPRREAIRKLCLSLGLLQPGDSRDVVVEVLQVVLDHSNKKKTITSEEVQKKVIALRKKNKLNVRGVAPSNIRRQIKRLKDLHLIEKIKNEYRITEFENFSTIFEERIEKYHLPQIITRVKEYCKAIK
jgi:hypothetical protein